MPSKKTVQPKAETVEVTKKQVVADPKKVLSSHLSSRPNKDDLIERNILKGGHVAPSLVAAQDELKKKKLEDNLKGKLASRSSKDDLLNSNILKADPTQKGAPTGAILAAQAELQKSKLQDDLNKKIKDRAAEEELLKKKILKEPVTQTPSNEKKLKKRGSERMDSPADKAATKKGKGKQ